MKIGRAMQMASNHRVWVMYAERSPKISAVFYAPSRAAVWQQAVAWAGQGDPMWVLEQALDSLEEAVQLATPPASAALPGLA